MILVVSLALLLAAWSTQFVWQRSFFKYVIGKYLSSPIFILFAFHFFFFCLAGFNEVPRMGGAKFVKEIEHNHRQALSHIDQNIVGANLNPCLVYKAEFEG